jgi:hypothetical protein
MTNALRALASLLVALCLLAAGATPSFAQDGPEPDGDALEVSLDGLTWSDAITTPLFDPALRWVPGDVRTARFFVRNNREESGDLQVVIDRTISEALRDTGFLTIAARAGNGRWREIAAGGRQVLIASDNVGAGQQMGVQLRASFDYAAAPNQTMVLASDLDLTITLTQDGIVRDASSGEPMTGFDPAGPDGPDGPDPAVADANGELPGAGGALPDTGSPLRPWVLPLALSLLASGAVLLARRRRDDDDQVEPAETGEALTLP